MKGICPDPAKVWLLSIHIVLIWGTLNLRDEFVDANGIVPHHLGSKYIMLDCTASCPG